MQYQQPVTLKTLPSTSTITLSSNSFMNSGKGLIRIYYKDNSYKSFSLQEEVTAQEVCELFAWDFLHLEKKVAAHFSLRVIIDGKDIRQLKAGDRPLRIQKDLLALKIAWNTEQNYFLFCLSEETKRRITTRVVPPGMPTPPLEPSVLTKEKEKEKEKYNKRSEVRGSKSFSKKLSFLVPRRLTSSPWRAGHHGEEKKDKPYLPQSQSVPQVSLSPHSLMRTKSEQTLPTNGEAAVQRQEVSLNLKKLINEEKKKLQMNANNKTETSNNTNEVRVDNNNDDHPKNGTTTEQTKEITPPREVRRELTLHGAVRKEAAITREPIKKEISMPYEVTAEPPSFSVSEEPEPTVSPIMPRSISMPKINKMIEEEDIAHLFDNLFDWYDNKSTPRKPKEESNGNKADGEDMDDETFDNILATLKTLEQLDAK